ncbi:MAG: hypothetical protein MUF49_22930 [Oculatellaceae cyanobacterium Prado106]|nr:hypothetical protein [Oculatellaceae cyanobacterium Prado106]
MDDTTQNLHLDHQTAIAFLEKLPISIQQALLERAQETEFPIEAAIESAIATSLDPEALSFVDCKPGRDRCS